MFVFDVSSRSIVGKRARVQGNMSYILYNLTLYTSKYTVNFRSTKDTV